MPIAGLDHYALLASDPERTVRFYSDVVGLHLGYRPALSFEGAWLYVGTDPIVHVIFGRDFAEGGTGAVDHLAFRANGNVDDAIAKLQAHNVPYSMRTIERTGVVQVFFRDPDQVGVELNFSPA